MQPADLHPIIAKSANQAGFLPNALTSSRWQAQGFAKTSDRAVSQIRYAQQHVVDASRTSPTVLRPAAVNVFRMRVGNLNWLSSGTRRSSPGWDSQGALDVRVWAMRTGIVVEVTAAERDRLEAIVADRNSPQKHVCRAGIVLATADGFGTVAIMRHTAKSKTVVWRWQERFAREDVDGPLRQGPSLAWLSPSAQRWPSGSSHDARRTAGRDDPLDRPRRRKSRA